MSTNEKQHQLSQIKTYHFQDLISFIDTGAITLTEMINAGLSNYTVEDINQHYASKKQAPVNENEVVALCNKIEKGEYRAETIKNLLISGTITEAQLLQHTTLGQELINQIKIKDFSLIKLNYRYIN